MSKTVYNYCIKGENWIEVIEKYTYTDDWTGTENKASKDNLNIDFKAKKETRISSLRLGVH